MTCFFTSSPTGPDTPEMNPANGLIHELHLALPYPCRALYICSDPDDEESTDLYASLLVESMERVGFAFSDFDVLDWQTIDHGDELLRAAQFIILAGGHVPTQNAFFREIGLKDMLAGFDGVLMGISAGSMNSASTVYAHPEREGEAVDPDYERFLSGLGLTDISIIPHYNTVQGAELDGLDIFKDIAFPDSMGRAFLVLPDGSYVLSKGGKETLHGEAYVIHDGKMEQISADGDVISLD